MNSRAFDSTSTAGPAVRYLAPLRTRSSPSLPEIFAVLPCGGPELAPRVRIESSVVYAQQRVPHLIVHASKSNSFTASVIPRDSSPLEEGAVNPSTPVPDGSLLLGKPLSSLLVMNLAPTFTQSMDGSKFIIEQPEAIIDSIILGIE